MRPLQNRDRNKMAKLTPGKRKVIDLTADDSEDEAATSRLPKTRRGETHPSSRDSQSLSTINGGRTSSFQGGSQFSYGHSSSSQQHSLDERTAWLADDDDDFNLIVASTQDNAEGSDQFHPYGEMPTKIVGVQYYKGYSNPGEYILMRREPGNPYDSNAIRIDNVAGTQIGHIPRRVAEKLARYIDERSLLMEGRLAGEIGQFDCALTVFLYGPDPQSDRGQELQTRMKSDKLPIKALQAAEKAKKQREKEKAQAEKQRLAEARRAAAGGQGSRIPSNGSSQFANQMTPSGSSQVDMSDILEASQRIDPRSLSKNAEKLGASEEELANMRMATQPQAIETKLLPYQLQALQWLLDQEQPQLPDGGSGKSVQLWRADKGSQYTNLASNYSTRSPTLASGGILADDMGLGKTLQMISLVAVDAERFGRGPTLVSLMELNVLDDILTFLQDYSTSHRLVELDWAGFFPCEERA